MTTTQVHRPARHTRPVEPGGTRTVEPPPTLPEGSAGGGTAQALLPLGGVASSMVLMTLLRGSVFVVVGALLLVVTAAGTLGLLLSQRGQAARKRRRQRERYLDYLEQLREGWAVDERRLRSAAVVADPAAGALPTIAGDAARRWERHREDSDFLQVRVGLGRVPGPSVHLPDNGSALTPVDPFMLAEVRALIRRHAAVDDMPVVVPLEGVGVVTVVGARADVLAAVRVLLAQAVTWHAPDDVALAAAFSPAAAADWEWLKWLPHTRDPSRRHGPVAAHRLGPDLRTLSGLLGDDLSARVTAAADRRFGRAPTTSPQRLVVLDDGYGSPAGALDLPDTSTTAAHAGVTVVHLLADRLHEPRDVGVRVSVHGAQVSVEDLRGREPAVVHGTLDRLDRSLLEGLARALSPLRLSPDAGPGMRTAPELDFAAGLGTADAADVRPRWTDRLSNRFLRVPIGLDDDGTPLELDLKESAQHGMGPHGLCVGATGSGKSELLRTLVLGAVATHSPDDLSLILVDFKGGATFAPFEGIPHVVGMITNLEDDAGLVARVHASLAGEVRRRQQQLRDAGSVASIGEYARRRAEDPTLPPMPHLMVIIDEFGELLADRPDLVELLISIGRIGRSIGVHLLLASQRIESGKLRGLDTYLSYRLGLRTFSEEESRTVLDSPDAFHLPSRPGYGYLKVDTSVYRRFKAGYVSGPAPQSRPPNEPARAPQVLPYTALPAASPARHAATTKLSAAHPDSGAPTLLDTAAARLREVEGSVPLVWLPPLPRVLTLDALNPVAAGQLRVPVGLLDDPSRQRQGPWHVDLSAAGGHLAVAGAPQSGKTMLLRTLAFSLAVTHTPRQVAVYAVDLSGGGLGAIGELPHVGGVTGRTDRERVRRTVEEVRSMLDQREDVFRTRGVESVTRMRERHGAGELPELTTADVVLLIDGYGALRDDFEDLEDAVADLLQRGGGYGVHIVASVLRWSDIRLATQATFGTRVELRSNDPSDSIVDRKLAATLRADNPGRVLTADSLFAQVALPRLDGEESADGLAKSITALAAEMHADREGPVAPPVRVLPPVLTAAALPRQPDQVAFGVAETDLQPVSLDLAETDPHLLVVGESECGKTNLLHLLAAGLVEQHAPDDLVLAVFDPRRRLRGSFPEEYVGGYATNAAASASLAAGVAAELAPRLQADRPAGSRVVLVVDDYDLLTSGGQQPLAPLAPLLANGPDIGVHLLVARRAAGAGRALYDGVISTALDGGATALLMNGDRSEGPLMPGVHLTRQPVGRGLWVRRGRAPVPVQTGLLGD
jgi:DNA segregation ATPase FtsK/SpoIIIE, S-DNA-T family